MGLGARQVDVGQGPGVSWYVLADLEGNEFCLLAKTAQEIRRVSQPGSAGTPPPHG